MPEVVERVDIDLPVDAAWAKLRDLSLAHRYVPGVAKVTIDTEATEGVGASRTVYLDRWPKQMNETVERWQDGVGFTLRLHLGDQPIAPIFQSNHFSYALSPNGAPNGSRTTMTLTMAFEPRGWLGRLLAGTVALRAFKPQLQQIARNLKAFYES